jgi:hypothetical protein
MNKIFKESDSDLEVPRIPRTVKAAKRTWE